MSVYDIFPVKELSGNVVTFEDGADGIPLESLSAIIEPIQNLHGYAKPWPGGGGKNIFPLTDWFQAGYTVTNNGVTMTVNADGSITLSGTASSQADFYLSRTTGGLTQNPLYVDAGTYTISMQGTQTLSGVKLVMSGSGQNGYPYSEASSNGAAKTGTVTDATQPFNYFLLRITSGTVTDGTYYIQLESGSTATAWEPYANICPISGLTGLSVYRTGKNLLPYPYTSPDGQYSGVTFSTDGEKVVASGTTSNSFIFTLATVHLAAGTYTLSVDGTHTNVQFRVRTSGRNVATITPSVQRVTFTLSEDSIIIFDIVRTSSNIDINTHIMCELGSTATSWESYNGNTYAVDWTTPAGTVYGGTVDVVSGELTVDMVNIPSYNGETINEPWLSSMDAYAEGTTPTIGAQVVYTLATPLTYQLTAQEITTLLGLNNVWATVAPITVKYHAQVQTENVRIDNLFVDGVDMQADGWFLKWRKLAAPKPKTDYVSVWGRDGDIDLTENESDGQVFYENRELTMDMVYIGDNWTQAYSELLDKLHGKDCMVQFTSDPYWYWTGRVVASLFEHKPHSLTMNGIMFPYKLSVSKNTASATVNGATEETATEVVLHGSRMRVSPKVTVTGDSITLKWGNKTQTLSAGTYYVRGLKVGSDDVTIKVWGTGTVNFEYRKGML